MGNGVMPLLMGKVTGGDIVSEKQILVDVSAEKAIGDVLAVLADHGVLSVPVFLTEYALTRPVAGTNETWKHRLTKRGKSQMHLFVGAKQYIGIISVVDIISFVFKAESMDSALNEPVHKALGATQESETLWLESSKHGAWPLFERLAKGAHRALIVPPTERPGEPIKLLTQTDVLKFLAAHKAQSPDLEKLLAMTLKELTVTTAASRLKHKSLVTVTGATTLAAGLEKMLQHKIQAVAVVDASGNKLLSTLSVADLRGTLAETVPELKSMTVAAFLQRQNPGLQAFNEHPDLAYADSLPSPLTCTLDDKLGDVIDSILGCGVHRSWLVDENKKPVDVLTCTDVIEAVVRAHSVISEKNNMDNGTVTE